MVEEKRNFNTPSLKMVLTGVLGLLQSIKETTHSFRHITNT
jgi:hypothetical protein